MKLNLELGEKMSEPVSVTSDAPKDRMYYPELRVTKKEPLDIPKEGIVTFRYKKIENSEREGSYSCTFEMHELVSVESDEVKAPSKRDKSAEDALDDLAEKRAKERSY